MDPKVLNPSLCMMLTKTVKALCEVNINFEKKLEITGCLHIRSDGDKILSCLIDEESMRSASGMLLSQRNAPETVLAQQSAVMALLTASHQMSATTRHDNGSRRHMCESGNNMTHTATDKSSYHSSTNGLCSAVMSATTASAPEMKLSPLPPVNSFIQNREVLLGMLQDRCRKPPEDVTVTSTAVSNSIQSVHQNSGHIKTEPIEQHNCSTNPSVNGVLPHLATLPSFPMLVSGGWPMTTTLNSSPSPSALEALSSVGAGNPLTPTGSSGSNKRKRNAAAADLTPPTASSPNSTLPDTEIMTTVNSKGQKKFQCMFCGILLSTKNYLKNHVNAVHTKSRVYPCELCERFFYSAGALRIHKLRHHWANSKKHQCTLCTETFLLPVELRRHLVKKHGESAERHGDGDGENGPGSGESSAEQGLQDTKYRHFAVDEDNNQNLEPYNSDPEADDSLSTADLSNDSLQSHLHNTVIVHPEAPPDGIMIENHIHPNQNEMGIPDDFDDDDIDEDIRENILSFHSHDGSVLASALGLGMHGSRCTAKNTIGETNEGSFQYVQSN